MLGVRAPLAHTVLNQQVEEPAVGGWAAGREALHERYPVLLPLPQEVGGLQEDLHKADGRLVTP